jgi:hypothetical protein
MDLLIPNNDLTAFTTAAPTVTGSGLNAAGLTQYTNGFGTGVTQWTTGTLAEFLVNSGSPANPLNAFLPATQGLDPGATGFDVFQVNAGAFNNIPTPNVTPSQNNPAETLPDIFSLSGGIPEGAYIVAFLTEADGSVVATANSAALLVDSTLTATPLPAAVWMFGGALGLGTLMLRRKKKSSVSML